MNVIIKQADHNDFESISKVIADQNQNPLTHCIQSDTGKDYQAVQNEIVRLVADSGICFVIASRNDQLIGTLGCELDEDLGRGWTRGPFVIAEKGQWNEIAKDLLEGLLKILPSTIHRLDSFLNIANEPGNQFYLTHGFQKLRLVHVYTVEKGETPFELFGNCEPLNSIHANKFVTLHDSVFPQTYSTGQRIVAKIGENHQVFVYLEGDELLGYSYAAVEESTGEGSVEFIGVREDLRGKGIGRLLLCTALHWLFAEKRVARATLVVNDNLVNARSLYESVGFRLIYTGLHSRREW